MLKADIQKAQNAENSKNNKKAENSKNAENNNTLKKSKNPEKNPKTLQKINKRAEKAGISEACLKMIDLNTHLTAFSALDFFENVSDPTSVSMDTLESIKSQLEASISAFESVVCESSGVTHFFDAELELAKIKLKFSLITFKLLVGLNPKNRGCLQERLLKEGIDEFEREMAILAERGGKWAVFGKKSSRLEKMERVLRRAKDVDSAVDAFKSALVKREELGFGARFKEKMYKDGEERAGGVNEEEMFREFEWLFGSRAEILTTQKGIQAVCGEIVRFFEL